jgi:hypothetical protein
VNELEIKALPIKEEVLILKKKKTKKQIDSFNEDSLIPHSQSRLMKVTLNSQASESSEEEEKSENNCSNFGGSGDSSSPRDIDDLEHLLYTKYKFRVEHFSKKNMSEGDKLIFEKYTEGLTMFFIFERAEYKLLLLENVRYFAISAIIVSFQMLNRVQMMIIFTMNLFYIIYFIKCLNTNVNNSRTEDSKLRNNKYKLIESKLVKFKMVF